MNGDADQVVPHDTSGPRAVKLVQNGTLKTYPGYPHGTLTTHADTINAPPADLYPVLIVPFRVQTEAGPVRVRIAATGGTCALGPAVGNDILCALTWSAALTMVYAATCRFACIFR